MPTDPHVPKKISRHEGEELLLKTEKFSVVRTKTTDTDGRETTKDVIRHPGAVVILPVLQEQRICLIRNRRITVDEQLLEAPAGTLDPGESPLVCAQRELAEETGYRAEQMDNLGWFYLSPGILDERMHLFIASKLSPGQPNLMPDEHIVNEILHLDAALDMVRDGTIHDAKTIVALLRYQDWRSSISAATD